MAKSVITAKQILALLAARHGKDVFVTECKTGPSLGAKECPRMDAWTMNKSWSRPWSRCYEIKVSRSDFIGDKKWPGYLRYCNEMWFVCPHNLIDADELPAECGLIYVTKTGRGLRIKKQAPLRPDVQIPESLYRYLLICRTVVRDEDTKMSKIGFWKDWLETKELNRDLGWRVSRSLREEMDHRVFAAEARNNSLALENEKLQSVRDVHEPVTVVDPWTTRKS